MRARHSPESPGGNSSGLRYIYTLNAWGPYTEEVDQAEEFERRHRTLAASVSLTYVTLCKINKLLHDISMTFILRQMK